MAQHFILQENVLTDNVLIIPDSGKVFKGQYIGIIKEYSFANAWSDKEAVKRFRSKGRLTSYLAKRYPNSEVIDSII